MTSDLTLEKLQDVCDIIVKSCKEKYMPPKEKIIFSATNYDILENEFKDHPKNMKILKERCYRVPDMP